MSVTTGVSGRVTVLVSDGQRGLSVAPGSAASVAGVTVTGARRPAMNASRPERPPGGRLISQAATGGVAAERRAASRVQPGASPSSGRTRGATAVPALPEAGRGTGHRVPRPGAGAGHAPAGVPGTFPDRDPGVRGVPDGTPVRGVHRHTRAQAHACTRGAAGKTR